MYRVMQRVRYRLLAAVGLSVAAGLGATSWFYLRAAENSSLEAHRQALHKTSEAVIGGMESLMVEGHAAIMPEFARRLGRIPDLRDFRILRPDGSQAFLDNDTINRVNQRLGGRAYKPRTEESRVAVMDPRDPLMAEALLGREAVHGYATEAGGDRVMHFLDPVFSGPACAGCHGDERKVLGVVKLTSSLAPIERDVLRAREEALLVLGAMLLLTLLPTGYVLGRTVVRPIERVTGAIARAEGGDLSTPVPVESRDELGQAAQSFNVMTSRLSVTYDGLHREQDKLTTVLQGACEAIVVTDALGEVVLVNAAAEKFLGKSAARISAEGFHRLLDDPPLIERLMAARGTAAVESLEYGGRVLRVSASMIRDEAGEPLGSAALLRDITEEKRLEEELRRLSSTDPLTGLYNRARLDEALALELRRAHDKGGALSVAMLDVDHFKRFNDEHGHDLGDRVLQAVARALRGALRTYDLACRYGGEEFVAILPDTTAHGAMALAERLRQDVAHLRVEGLAVTISVGVASWPGTPAERAGDLLAAADAALYRAKREGRDRVCLDSPELVG